MIRGIAKSLESLLTQEAADAQGGFHFLMGFGTIPLATCAEGEQNISAEMVQGSRRPVREPIELVPKTNPDILRFDGITLQLNR